MMQLRVDDFISPSPHIKKMGFRLLGLLSLSLRFSLLFPSLLLKPQPQPPSSACGLCVHTAGLFAPQPEPPESPVVFGAHFQNCQPSTSPWRGTERESRSAICCFQKQSHRPGIALLSCG